MVNQRGVGPQCYVFRRWPRSKNWPCHLKPAGDVLSGLFPGTRHLCSFILKGLNIPGKSIYYAAFSISISKLSVKSNNFGNMSTMSTDVVVWLRERILEALGVAVYPQQLWSFEEVSVLLCTHKSCCLCGRALVYNFSLMSEWTMWPN